MNICPLCSTERSECSLCTGMIDTKACGFGTWIRKHSLVLAARGSSLLAPKILLKAELGAVSFLIFLFFSFFLFLNAGRGGEGVLKKQTAPVISQSKLGL